MAVSGSKSGSFAGQRERQSRFAGSERWLPTWLGPYKEAYADLFDRDGNLRPEGSEYGEYVQFKCKDEAEQKRLDEVAQGRTYDAFLEEAAELATAYASAAYKVCYADQLDDRARCGFMKVVSAADLGAPLEKDILKRAKKALADWNSGSDSCG